MVECGSDQQSQGYSSLLLGLCQEIAVSQCSSITV